MASDTESGESGRSSMLASRVLVTWAELTAVGIAGGFVGGALGGALQYLTYLVVTLLSVGVLFYNVDAHLTARLAEAETGAETSSEAESGTGTEAAGEP